MSTMAQSPFTIIFVGAGTIGLAIALALRQSGHNVFVLERRKRGDETSGRGSGYFSLPQLHKTPKPVESRWIL